MNKSIMRLNHVTLLSMLCLWAMMLAVPAGAAANLIFKEDWESGTKGTWNAPQGTAVSIVNPHSGSYSLAVDRVNGGGGNISHRIDYATQSGYLSFWQWQPLDFKWVVYESNQGHWFRLYMTKWIGLIDIVVANTDSRYMTVQENFYGAGGINFYTLTKYDGSVLFGDGNWHHTELQYQLNTPGQANGFLKIWYDGKIVSSLYNLLLLPAGVSVNGLEQLNLPSNAGTTDSRLVYFDDTEVWSGCPDVTAFSGIPSCQQTNIVISPATLPSARAGTSYTATLTAAGGKAPYGWTVTSGNLPAGLSLNKTTGVISGVPVTAGRSDFTILAADSSVPSATASKSYTIIASGTSEIAGSKQMAAVGQSQIKVEIKNGYVKFVLGGQGKYKLSVFDLSGATVWQDAGNSGSTILALGPKFLKEGIYIAQLQQGAASMAQKFVVVR